MALSPAADDLLHRARQVVAEEVAPLLQMDGTAIEVIGIEAGIVRVRFGGAVGCCPGSVPVLIQAVEEALRRRLPEVEYLEAVP
jgi:Fe-S cluster biogenesis protein NfuA